MRVLHGRVFSFSPISAVRFPAFRRRFLRPPSQTLTPRLTTTRSPFSSSAPMESADVEAPESKKPTKPWLVVGLGNPGKLYEGTRHNVGFELVDAIAEAEGISINTVSHKALLGKGIIGDVPIILAKPQTFMNLSGNSVGSIVSYYKIPQKQVLVVYDDLDTPFGKLKLSPKGGHGGHNGMRNIIDHFKGSRDIMRLKIGIGRPPGKTDAVKFVLKKFNKDEREELNFKFQEGVEAVRILLLEGFNKSATFVNTAKPLKQLG